MVDIIAIAIPFFLGALALEILVARIGRRRYHRFNDSITDLSCGVGDQVFAALLRTLTLAPYGAVYGARHLLDLPAGSAATWALGILGVDFTYYWFHRFSHRVNIGWATHVVHHQSEEYNLAVALRQSWFAKLYHWIFDLPLALLGIPPVVYVSSVSINLLYQFWIHTRTIGKLGPLEWVFNTPSHHRVHHGCNRKYLDRNYAGMLIVWDRLFGTFQPEEEEPSYGTVKPLASWNPAWANVHLFVELAVLARQTPRWGEKLLLWIKPPEWRPASLAPVAFPADEELASRPRYDADAALNLHGYIGAHFAILAAGTMALLLSREHAPWSALVGLVAAILATVVLFGFFLERRPRAVPLEGLRLALVGACGVILGISGRLDTLWVAIILAIATSSAIWLWRHRLDVNDASRAGACATPSTLRREAT